ncbi:glycosyltransferase family 2 protein [Streptomyces sp. NPDC057686]|uniref:glycosyltransferase family 2 protein n=1 Tax=Streptomyces sp. NPDC057686 TaxID=3346212 RepID=UPI003696B4C2
MPGVVAAYLHPDTVSHSFMDSMWRVAMHEAGLGRSFDRFAVRSGPMTIPEARNLTVSTFLGSDAEFLWCVDSDMGFADDVLERLVGFCGPTTPVVGAFCFGQFSGDPDGMGGYKRSAVPTLYEWNGRGGLTLDPDRVFPADEMVQVGGTGAACLILHRSVLERMQGKYGNRWFTRIVKDNGGTTVGEDLSFCYRLREMGVPVFVHTGIRTTHHKSVFLGQ